MLYLDGLVYFVEDDLFHLTLGYDLDMNCVMLVQLNWLFVEFLLDDDYINYEYIRVNYSPNMLVLEYWSRLWFWPKSLVLSNELVMDCDVVIQLPLLSYWLLLWYNITPLMGWIKGWW